MVLVNALHRLGGTQHTLHKGKTGFMPKLGVLGWLFLQEIESVAKTVAFISTPSVYFSLQEVGWSSCAGFCLACQTHKQQ